jgi:small subunit ribosomal protein S17
MADEQDNETTETPEPDQAPEVTPEAAQEAEASAEAPSEEPAAEAAQEAEAPSEEPAAEEPAEAEEKPAEAEEAPAAAEEEAAPEADGSAVAAPAEPVEQLPPKERRRRVRSTHAGEARPARSPEDRHAERVAVRQEKAVRRRRRRASERTKATERRASRPAPEPLAPVHAPVEGTRRVRQGIVVSDKAEKTITVRIDIARRHRRYEKIVRSSSTLHAHDENNDAHEGDVVRVIESRPLSRTKRWALVDVVERAR